MLMHCFGKENAWDNFKLALMMADGSLKGKADPAFEAHRGVIGHWASAVWNEWLCIDDLSCISRAALAKTAAAQQPWRVLFGPAAAFVCTAQRLSWEVISAIEVITDEGRRISFLEDPPVVVTRLVDDAVRRWKWKNVAAQHPSLPQEGVNIRPIFKLINSEERRQVGTRVLQVL